MFIWQCKFPIWIDPLLNKNFDGHVDVSPPCIGRFKNLQRNPIFFILLRGFDSVLLGFLRGNERLAGSSFDSSNVSSIVLYRCTRVKGFTVCNLVSFWKLMNTVRVVFLTLLVVRELGIALPLSLLVVCSIVGEKLE